MHSLITTDIIRYNDPKSATSYRSHLLHPQSDITIICIVWSAHENITSVVEDHFLESISGCEWKHWEEDTDFSYITEGYNHFLTNLAIADSETVSIIFAVERASQLMVSSIGECEVILQEKNGWASSIHEDTRWHHRFELISSGEIPAESSIFIVSKFLEWSVWDTFYADAALLEGTEFGNIASEVLTRELHETVHIVRIKHTLANTLRWLGWEKSEPKWKTISKELYRKTTELQQHPKVQDTKTLLNTVLQKNQSVFTWVFLGLGVLIFFWLVSYIISALFSATGSQTKDAKNLIIEAKNLIESSQKLTSNTSAFDVTISSAEKILTELETQWLYIKDIEEQRNKIEAMKKEIYDIQTFSLENKTTLIPFESDKIEPLWLSEKEKKISIIGKKATVYDHALGDAYLNIKSYPSEERAKDYAVLDDGNFYILTESNKIIASRKNSDISYISVSGQEWWENADGISTFNGNIYLWNRLEWQIYKHRPWINGFSTKAPVLPNPSSGIADVGIDGGFYILKEDQKIIRFLSSSNTQSGILINKIPGDYTIGKNGTYPKLYTRWELNYIYIFDKDKIWIFQPDAKRFQDIRSWNYIAQIQLQSKEELRDIAIVRDGLIYILTEKWVYDMVFEIVDNKVILRS